MMTSVPATKYFIRPVLQRASTHSREFTRREAGDAMAEHFNLSPAARDERTAGGKIRFYSNANWAVSHLKYAGLLRRTDVGRYEITEEGRKEAFSSSKVMTKAYLADNFPIYQIERDRASRKNKNQSEASEGKSRVPAMNDFMRPILRWASERSGEFTSREAAEAMVEYFNLSDETRNELTQEGFNMVDNRTNLSITHLKAAELLTQPSEKSCEITQAGRDEAFSSDERMTPAYLENKFPAYRSWKNKEE